MSRRLRPFLVAALLLGSMVLMSGCSDLSSAQNWLAPEGTVANKQRDLMVIYLIPATVIFFLVEIGLVVIAFKFRHRKGNDEIPRQTHGNTALEIGWTVLPALLLAVLGVPTLLGIVDLARAPRADAYRVDATGFQWAWRFAYPNIQDKNGQPVATSGELHIPAGKEIGVYLHSPDVIHSFWIPKLAGKTDVIPGHVNHMWLKADHPGDYSAECAEFCGFGHATMRFRVIVQSPEDFAAWEQAQASASGGTVDQSEASAARE